MEEKSVKQPQVAWVFAVQMVKSSESGEEGSPPACELGANFYPESLNPGVAGGSVQAR